MYQFQSGICRGHTIGAQWQPLVSADVFCYDLLSEFRDIYLTLTHPAQQGNIYVNLEPLRAELFAYPGTLATFLESIGDRSLPHVDSLPNADLRYVRFGDAVQSGYTLNLGYAGINYPAGLQTAAFPDVQITRIQFATDMTLLDTHCLLTVNGLIHDTTADAKKAFVLDGAVSARLQNKYHVGIVSFLDVGRLTRVRLNPDNIQPFEPGGQMKEKIRFTVSNDLSGKSVFLVLGGFLVFLKEGTFYMNGEKQFVLDLNQLPYIERLLDSQFRINLASLQLPPVDGSPNLISLEAAWSDDVIRRYMTLSQSFLVIVDTPYLAIERFPVQRAAFPGQFITYQDPVNPLMGGYGMLFDYWKINEQKRWSVNVHDNFYRQYVHTEASKHLTKNASDAQDSSRRYDHSQAWFLEISSSK